MATFVNAWSTGIAVQWIFFYWLFDWMVAETAGMIMVDMNLIKLARNPIK